MGDGIIRAAAAALLSLTAGCGTLASPHTKHFILVHSEGYPIALDRKWLTPAEFEEKIWPEIHAGIDQHIKDAEAAGEPPRLLLHVHGGLNTYRGALEQVDDLRAAQGTIQNPGLPNLAKYHLLFINWDSSLVTSVLDDLFVIRLGRRTLLQGIPSSPFIGAARAAQSGFLAPQSLYLQLGNAIEAVRLDDDKKWRECAPSLAGQDSDRWVAPSTVTFFLFYPLRALSVPVIHGFGMSAWDMMKRRAALAMAPELKRGQPYQGGGHLLMTFLKRQIPRSGKWLTRKGEEKDLEITLLGHSMGTIILNRILEDFSTVYFHRIIYLASAASIDDVRGAVLPYLRRHDGTQFWGFSLSEVRESGEWNFVDVFERGSLLVWVDHLFERINAPGDRAFGRARNLRQYFDTPDEFTEAPPQGRRLFLVKFDRGSEDPEKHGDFSDPKILDRVLGIVHRNECEKQPWQQ